MNQKQVQGGKRAPLAPPLGDLKYFQTKQGAILSLHPCILHSAFYLLQTIIQSHLVMATPAKAAPAPNNGEEELKDATHTPSQRYLSTRGGSYGV